MPILDRERWQELEPLLNEALDLEPAARERWLADVSARSPALAGELTQLLRGEAVADRDGFLVEPPATSLAGTRIGAYRLEQLIGQGGMGSVWLARRADGRFEGVVAVKLINLALLTAAGGERFQREGSLLARLSHPGIARLLDAGVGAAGQPYLVLEYVDGQPIDVYVRERNLTREETIRLFLQVLAAASHAHASLVVHRDLKPSNILVSPDGTVKLLDFGIARLLDEGEQACVTTEGARAFTPRYAAPEQILGDPITVATDVYALGLLLYLLLGGRHPAGEDPTPAALIAAALDRSPAPLRAADLDLVLAKAMRKEPGERYQSAAAFADDLERYLRREPVSARAPSRIYRARRFIQRNQAGVAAGVATALLLLGATAFSLWQMRVARQERDAALKELRRTGVMVNLQSVLAADLRDTDGRPLTGAERIRIAEGVLNRQLGDQPGLVSEGLTDLSNRFYVTGDLASERAMLWRADLVARRYNLPLERALADCTLAYSYAYDDRLDSARSALGTGLDALARVRGDSPRRVESLCLDAKGQYLIAADSAEPGLIALRQAVHVTDSDPDDPRRLATINDLAAGLRLVGRSREALPYHRRVVAELEGGGFGDTQDLPNASAFLAITLLELGEAAAADSEVGILVRSSEARHGAGRVNSLLAYLYGRAKLEVGQSDSAETWLLRAQADTTSAAGLVPWLPPTLMQLRLDQGRLDEAERLGRDLTGSARGRRVSNVMLRARLRRQRGDTASATAMLEQALHAVATDGGRPLAVLAVPFITAGYWRLGSGDGPGADSLARMARAQVTYLDSLAAARSGFVGQAELLRAQAFHLMRRDDSARAALVRAMPPLISAYRPGGPWVQEVRALGDSLKP